MDNFHAFRLHADIQCAVKIQIPADSAAANDQGIAFDEYFSHELIPGVGWICEIIGRFSPLYSDQRSEGPDNLAQLSAAASVFSPDLLFDVEQPPTALTPALGRWCRPGYAAAMHIDVFTRLVLSALRLSPWKFADTRCRGGAE